MPIDLVQRQFCLGTSQAGHVVRGWVIELDRELAGIFDVDVLMNPDVFVFVMVVLRDEPVGDEDTSIGDQCPDLVLIDDCACAGSGDGEPLDPFVVHTCQLPELPACVCQCGLLCIRDSEPGAVGHELKSSCYIGVCRTILRIECAFTEPDTRAAYANTDDWPSVGQHAHRFD